MPTFLLSQGLLFLISCFAGFLGALLGIGGGIILIPVLTFVFHTSIEHAIATSIVAVIATSSGAAATYVKDRLSNVRLAIFLEVATTLGAFIGVFLSFYIHGSWLYLLFAFLLLQSAWAMGKRKEKSGSLSISQASTIQQEQPVSLTEPQPTALLHRVSSWAQKLQLNSSYPAGKPPVEIPYQVAHLFGGFLLMIVAGILSALLGIGSGALKVLAMDRAMKLPIRVSSATSSFMIGVTASVSAWAFYSQGRLQINIVVPVALGVLLGSFFGTKAMVRLHSQRIRQIFVIVLLAMAGQMLWKGLSSGTV